MSSKISEIIPTQAHELIRDRIGAILAVEIAAQVTADGDYDMDANVYVERTKPFDKTEVLPAINVSLARASYDSQHMGSTKVTATYNIDVYTSAKTRADEVGDVRAAFKLQKLLGWCRFILEHPVYKTLDFAAPFIQRRSCREVNIAGPNPEDGTNQAMGRLSFTVEATETAGLLATIALTENYTTVKLSLTEKGHLFILEL